MPSHRRLRQPESGPAKWLERGAGRQLLADVQRMAIPELTRVFGQTGLYLRPTARITADLSGNMLAQVISLHRSGSLFEGQLRCADAELPISTASLSLVYALFVLESSPDPHGLVQEFARVLKPEGVALVISLNPVSLARLRWIHALGGAASSSQVERMAREAGLEVVRHQFIGPFWPSTSSAISDPGGKGWLDEFRAANLVVLRRRDVAMTPLRKPASAVSLRPGMSAG